MRYYVNAHGNYLGGWDENPPEGAIEVPTAPEDARQVWGGQAWQGTPVTAEAIAARRYQTEVAGITIAGMRVETDDRAKLLINGAVTRAQRDPEYVLKWKTEGVFIPIPAAQVILIGDAVADHIQACFEREAELLAELEAGTLTDEMLEQGWP